MCYTSMDIKRVIADIGDTSRDQPTHYHSMSRLPQASILRIVCSKTKIGFMLNGVEMGKFNGRCSERRAFRRLEPLCFQNGLRPSHALYIPKAFGDTI